MMNSIRGEITAKRPGSILILTGGIEWEVATSAASITAFPEPGEVARAFVYLYHREDQMKLFGFATEPERHAFLDLLKVTGIGPKQAVKILSRVNVDRLVACIDSGDADSLAAVPGVGVKTAGKIILTLKGKLSASETVPGGGDSDDLIAGLIEMGFERKKAMEAVGMVIAELKEQGLTGESLEREALRQAILRLS
jgi:Holliday junction DNA helicase RuvA